MQNWILFRSVTNSDGEFGSKRQKKMKNEENFIHADEFSFGKMKIFLMKTSSSMWKKKRRRCRIEFSLNCHKFIWRTWVRTAQETETQGKFNSCRRIELWPNWNFSYEKFVIRVEEENEEMQNWILFQTLTNSDREFVSQLHKKLKNKENFIRADEFSFPKIKIFLMTYSCWE